MAIVVVGQNLSTATPRYKALLLDFYGTLVAEDDQLVREILREIATVSPLCSDTGELGRAWLARYRALCDAAHAKSFRTQQAIEVASLEWLLANYQVPLEAQALSERLFAYWRAPQVFADGADFVARSRLPICVVSNIDTADLHAALAHAGWRFDCCVTSEDCRSYKPRPEIFQRALGMLGCAAGEVLHIGDSWGNDVVGAQQLGIAVAWVNRGGKALPAGARAPDFTVADLRELVEMAAGESGRQE
jgi:2-haloacid dehalogenase/putative hydrolase of the HAD superfamily